MPFASVSKRVLAQPCHMEKEFDLYENKNANEKNCNMNGFARRPVLTQRQIKGN